MKIPHDTTIVNDEDVQSSLPMARVTKILFQDIDLAIIMCPRISFPLNKANVSSYNGVQGFQRSHQPTFLF